MAAKILVIDDNKSRFEEVAQKRGFDVKVFTVFEDAMCWLSDITLVTEDQYHEHVTSHRQNYFRRIFHL